MPNLNLARRANTRIEAIFVRRRLGRSSGRPPRCSACEDRFDPSVGPMGRRFCGSPPHLPAGFTPPSPWLQKTPRARWPPRRCLMRKWSYGGGPVPMVLQWQCCAALRRRASPPDTDSPPQASPLPPSFPFALRCTAMHGVPSTDQHWPVSRSPTNGT